MVVLSLVASHKNVDLNTVARLSTGVGALPRALVEGGLLRGLVPLSTCNRLELYADTEEPRSAIPDLVRSVSESLAAATGLDAGFVRESFQVSTEEDTARHLFTVVSGLESAVVGEREITGQVRKALVRAREEHTASGELIRLFEAAARTARTVNAETALGERGRSIVSVALDLAEDVTAASWPQARVLLFGTGAYAGATMAALHERGCTRIGVYSATGRAAEFAGKRGGQPVSREELAEAMAAADVVIGCSGGAAPLSASAMPAGGRTVVDLALTRDFDPSVADIDGVELITLESVRLAAPEETVESVQEARDIVEQATQDFCRRRQGRSVDSGIVALRQHTMAVLEEEMDKVRHQYGCGAQADQMEFAMRRMVRSLLHTPMVRARQLAGEGRGEEFFAAIDALYALDPAEAQEPAPARRTAEAADTSSACRRPRAS